MANTQLKTNKVAEITLIFWLMKIVATTLGETLGDYLSMTLNLGYLSGIIITLGFFLTVLSIQLFSKKYSRFFIGWSSLQQLHLVQKFPILWTEV